MFRILTATGILILPLVSAFAQPEQVVTRIVTYAPGGLPQGFDACYLNGRKFEPFLASAGTLGLPIDYTGPARFDLRASPAEFSPPPEGQAQKPPLASVALPAGADNILLLCSSQADGKLRLTAYNISSKDLKTGDYRVFNFSKLPLSVILGENRFSIAPGKDTFVRDSKWHSEMMAFPIQIASVVGGTPKLVFSTYWEHYPQRRSLLFLFDGRHASEPITFANFSADLPAPKTASKPTISP